MTSLHLEINTIHCGFAETLMEQIEPNSIALSFWSPPYFVGKDYEKYATYESWQNLLKTVIGLHARALRPGGFLVINIADILCFEDPDMPRIQAMNLSRHKSAVTREMVLDAQRQHPEFSRYELAALLGCSEQTVDRRLNGNNIRGGKYNTQTRVKLVGGALESYGLAHNLYLYDKRVWVKDPTWANSRWVSNTLKAVSEYEDLYIFWKPGEYVIDGSKLSDTEWKEWGNRGVWYINSVRKNNDHEAKFPVELAQRVIRLFSNAGEIVLDPFMGSGTTAIAAIRTGRRFLGIEKESKYVELAREAVRAELAQPSLLSVESALRTRQASQQPAKQLCFGGA